jgi:hypothetical protein
VRLLLAREEGDTIPGFLAMPDGTITGGFDSFRRKFCIRRLQFLEDDDIGLRLVQPPEQDIETTVDAVDVLSRDLHLRL